MSVKYWEEAIYSGIFFMFCIFILSMIFENKSVKGNIRKICFFGAVTIAVSVLYEIVFETIKNLVIAYEDSRGGTETWLGNGMLSLANFMQIMLPGIVVITAALFLYKERWEEKVFVTLLIVLIETIVLNVFCEITDRLLSPGVVDGFYSYPHVVVRILIEIFWMSISAVVFRIFIKNILLEILDKIKEEVGKFLNLPIASYVVFLMAISVMKLLGLNFRSVYSSNVFATVAVIIGLVAMYGFMYKALLDAVGISAESAKVQADLMIASDIQRSALPSTFPAFPDRREFDVYANMRPAKEVGGDFYDFFLIDQDHLAIVIADVSGKGVPAALFMMAGKTTIRNQAIGGAKAGQVLTNSNEQLIEGNEKGLFITAFFGVLDLNTGELEFSNAGHNAPYICRNDQTVEMVKMRHGFVLGGMEGIQYRTEKTRLHPGEKILLYTDGVTEAVNTELELYGESRLEAELLGAKTLEIQDIVAEVGKSIDKFALGAMQADDITMLIVEYKGVAA